MKFHDNKSRAEAQKSRAEAFCVSPHDNCRYALAFAYRPHAFRRDDAAPARDPYGVVRYALVVVLFVHRSKSDVHDNCSRRLRLSANFNGVRQNFEGIRRNFDDI